MTPILADRYLENPCLPDSPTRIYLHIVTLINRRTGQEAVINVETLSDRFADVVREVAHLKVMNDLLGYEIYEVLDCNNPF